MFVVLLTVLLYGEFFYSKNAQVTASKCGAQVATTKSSYPSVELLSLLLQWVETGQHDQTVQAFNKNGVNCLYLRKYPMTGYFLNQNSNNSIMLQATHALDDLNTGKLVLSIINSDPAFKFGYISSVKRHQEDSSRHPTLVNLFSLELLRRNHVDTVIQIHGFAQKNRITEVGKAADVIISSGSEDGSFKANQIHGCLKNKFEGVYMFGKNIYELGATQNFLYEQMRASGFSNDFIHVELSQSMRQKLTQAQHIKSLAQCFYSGDIL